ncbi:MAG TPA: Gfo/Idh/MocA family oxidoreductase [bacterium]|nr:Gfo/Idh/MocA family oxidoreductase [bacterium]
MLKLSGFGDEIAADFETQLREMRGMHLNHIALRNLWGTNILDLNPKQKKKAKDLLRKYGMGVSEIGSPLGKVLITDPWEKEWERYERAIEMAHYFLCPRIRIFSFYFPEGDKPEQHRAEVIRRLKEMAERAEQEGLLLLLENEARIYGEDGLHCKDLADSVNSPHFKLIFDPANYVTCGTKPFSQWFEMQADHIVHLHIKDCTFEGRFTPAGQGDGEFPQLIRALAERGFTGYATMEPHLLQGGQFAGFTGPEKFVEATEAFRKVCDQAGMPHREVRIGVVGMGFIGMFHCDAMRQVPEAHLVAVADTVQSPNLKKAEEKFNVMAYTDPDELLQRPDIDAVTLGTPSGLHMEIAVKAANAKKHVLTEKPIEVTLEKADRMIQACRRNGVKLGVISQRRWDRGMKELKQAVDSGALGKLILGEAYVKWYRTQQYYDSGQWRGTWELDGGGCLMNQGVHTVDCLQWVMGGVAEVTAQTALLAHEKIEVEDIAQALLKFKNGAVGTIIASTAVYPGMDERIEVSGTKGTMIMNKSDIVFRKIMGEEEPADMGGKTERGSGAADPQAITNEGHVAQIQDFCQAIAENRDPMITGEDGRKPLEIILAVYQSARTGKPVKLPLKRKKK